MSPSTLSLVSLLLNLLFGGGLLVGWLKYRVQVRGEDRTDFDTIVAALKQQREEDRARIRELEQRAENLEAEISGLRIARDLDPFPNWVVDLQGCYRFVSRGFETHFLEPKKQSYRDIIGKRHEDVWPDEFCRALKALSVAAAKRPDGTARATLAVDVPALGRCEVTVHKFPIRFKGAIVATAGYFTMMEPEQQRLGA